MPDMINAKRITFSDTRDAHRIEDLPFVKRGETTRLLTGIGTPPIESAVRGVYIAGVVDGYKAWAEFRHARQPLGEMTSDEAYELETPMADLLSRNLFGVEDTGEFAGGPESAKRIRVYPSHPVSTFIPTSIWGIESIRHQVEEVDWDARIETLPRRASTEVMVMFEEGAYRPPRIVDDPEA